jgi:hypothetical protein
MTFLLSYTPIFFRASAAMGTVEFTGLEMMFRMAWQQQGRQHAAMAAAAVHSRDSYASKCYASIFTGSPSPW